MTEFIISAPGRIILSGDHAIINKEKNVVMASLDLRTTLQFCELPDEQRTVRIEFSNIDVSLNLPLEIVRNFSLRSDMKDMFEKYVRLVRYVKHFITVNAMWSTPEQRISLQTFFFLLLTAVYKYNLEIRSFHVCVSTELPIGGGLGSSTSFAVCLAACFIYWARLQKGNHDEFDENDLKKIAYFTKICDFYVQEYALEFDNYLCTYGKIQNLKYNNLNFPITLMNMPVIKILLIDTKIGWNNRERLQRMAELKHICPETADHVLDKVNEISQKIFETLYFLACNHKHPNSLREETYAELQKHIEENQQILSSNDLSHPRLDDMCSIAKSYGFAGKLTGFGGRFAYILLPPSTPEKQIRNLSTELEAKSFNVTKTSRSSVGGQMCLSCSVDGLRCYIPSVLWIYACLKNGAGREILI